MITITIRSLCIHGAEYVPPMIEAFTPFFTSSYDSQRIVVAAVFAELIAQRCGENVNLIEQLMNACLSRLIDDSHVVRKLSIRALGNVSYAPDSHVSFVFFDLFVYIYIYIFDILFIIVLY